MLQTILILLFPYFAIFDLFNGSLCLWYAAKKSNLIFSGTRVTAVLYATCHEPEYYSEPDVFKPERFLDADGCYRAPDRMYMAPFGAGENLEHITY